MSPEFQFSQSSLQDYIECRRRFYLRYVRELAWPGHETDQTDEQQARLRKGVEFHRLVYQHQMGISEAALSPFARDHDLDRWWEGYLQFPIEGLGDNRYPEELLSAPVAGNRLLAKLDLVSVVDGGRVLIVDWKTSRRRRETWLLERMQTKVYRYLIVRAGADLNGGQALEPERVEMVYWFAEEPERPIRLPYSNHQYLRDEEELSSLIEKITGLDEQDFTLTARLERCRFCTFRSLCDRGATPGKLAEFDTDFERDHFDLLEIDLGQVGELEF